MSPDYIASFSNGLASGHARPQTLVLSEAVLEDTQGDANDWIVLTLVTDIK